MTLGYDRRLYVLAFDHRGSFQKVLMGITEEPSPPQRERISDAKHVIYEGFQQAIADGAPKPSAGLLVDEEYGSAVARDAGDQGYVFAMPVEKSGQDEFDFEFGDTFGDHILEFNPTFSKVLVRYNPEGDREMNARQTGRLKVLSGWLHERGRRFLFELLVPADPAQLERVGGDAGRFDTEVRPGLMVRCIEELQRGGVEPDIWKIEGIDRREDCERIAEQVRSDGRDGVACVVLGRGADDAAVAHWLRQGAGVRGYIGFAIGRTIWWDPLGAYLKGEGDRPATTKKISENYRRMIEIYESAV